MKKNMGNVDRIIRLIIAAGLLALYFTGTIAGVWATVALVVAIIFIGTSLVSSCPIYSIVGLSTCPTKTSKSA